MTWLELIQVESFVCFIIFLKLVSVLGRPLRWKVFAFIFVKTKKRNFHLQLQQAVGWPAA